MRRAPPALGVGRTQGLFQQGGASGSADAGAAVLCRVCVRKLNLVSASLIIYIQEVQGTMYYVPVVLVRVHSNATLYKVHTGSIHTYVHITDEY